MSIRKKLLLSYFLIVFGPALLINEALFFNTRQELKKNQFTILATIADLKVDKIELFFHERLSDLITAQSYKNIKRNLPVLNRLGQDRNNPAILAAKDSLDRQIQPFQKAKHLMDVILVSPAGLVVYSSEKLLSDQEVGQPFHDSSGEILTKSRDNIFFSDIHYNSKLDHGYRMCISGPIHDYEGNFSGFVLLELDMEPIYEFIQDRTGMGHTGESLIAKKDGDQMLFLSPLRYEPKAALFKRSRMGGKKAVPMQSALHGENGVGVSFDYRDQEVIAAWRYIPMLEWGLVAKIDTTEAFASISKNRRISTTIILITLAFVTLIILWLARSITAPILSLQHGARRIGKGDLDHRLQVSSKDEIGELARTFNTMADRLAESYDTLETKVAERTSDLQKSRSAALSAMQDAKAEKHRAEDALARLEESSQELRKLSWAIEQSPITVLITDAEGTIEYVNQKFIEVTGYSREEAIGQNPKNLNSGEQSPEFYKELWDTIKSGRIWQGEFANKKKNGEIYWENTIISPIRDGHGEITNFVAVKEDITEKRQVDLDLKARIEELAKARSSMLNMMEDLKDARHAAEEATKAKSNFLANMSHEIRTPMNAILGMTYLALMTELTPKQEDYLVKIDLASHNLLEIINDILDFSKIEAGKLEMEAVDFSLEDVLANVANLVAVKAQEKGFELVLATGPDVPLDLRGDPLRLGQVLINLAGNAVKFTAAGEVVISTALVSEDRERAVLRFCVTDTGIGMNQEQVEQMFQAFSQADASITRQYGGTGLGLAISKQLIELMGGEIKVESEVGLGSSFYFTASFDRAAGHVTPRSRSVVNLLDARALVVDDSKTTRLMLSGILRSLGLQVKAADSGKEALKKLTRAARAGRPFELVLMDWQLPVMDGIETARYIKSDPYLAPTPDIILVTPYGQDEIANEAGATGLDGLFIVEQGTPSALLDTIMTVFSNRAGQRPGRRSTRPPDLQGLAGALVLLAEDNEINQQVAVELMEQAGLVVDIANNGREALKAVQEKDYQLILMDIQMPEMDGYAATSEIRKLESAGSKAPIIAMTAHAMSGDREKCLAAGMDDHIAKPIDPDKFYACLVRWIKPKGGGQRPAVSNQQDGGKSENQRQISEHPKGTRSVASSLTSFGAPARHRKVKKGQHDFPDSIPGVDLATGLKRVVGNKKLYLNLLRDFQKENESFSDQVMAALANRDIETARRLAHTLKGVSGTIGAMGLQEKALLLETGIKEQSENVQSLLEDTWNTLQAVLKGLRKTVPVAQDMSAITQPADETFDFETIAPKIGELRKLLEKSDMEAVTLFSEIKTALLSVDQDNTKEMMKKLDVFDFRGALKNILAIQGLLENINEERENNG